MNQIDADAFNEFERRGWAENSTEAYDRVFGPITRRVVDELLDAAGVGSQTRVNLLRHGNPDAGWNLHECERAQRCRPRHWD
jgi:hypothetical protein